MIVMMVVSAAVSAASAIQQGKWQEAAAERDRIQHDENAKLAKLEAAQKESRRLEESRKIRSLQVAQAAALGFDPTESRSFMAIQKEEERLTERDIDNIRLSGLVSERRSLLSADAAAIEAKAARQGSTWKAIGAITKGASQVTSYGADNGWFS